MEAYLTEFQEWVINLGERYNVNPLVLGILYAVGKGSMVYFLGVSIKNIAVKKPVTLTLLLAALGFSLPYFYVIIAGRNLPVWIYVFIGVMSVFGVFTIRKKLRANTDQN